MPNQTCPGGLQNRSAIARWRPFLIGVMLGLAFLMVIGAAVAQPVDRAARSGTRVHPDLAEVPAIGAKIARRVHCRQPLMCARDVPCLLGGRAAATP